MELALVMSSTSPLKSRPVSPANFSGVQWLADLLEKVDLRRLDICGLGWGVEWDVLVLMRKDISV